MRKVVCFTLCLLCLLCIASTEGGFLSRFSSIFQPIFPQVVNSEEFSEASFQAGIIETRKRKDTTQSDPCNRPVEQGFPDFCSNLEDGEYLDVWNPFCGYMVCKGNKGKRVACMSGTWMGIANEVFHSSSYYCRRLVVRPSKKERICTKPATNLNICKNAEAVEQMNMIDN